MKMPEDSPAREYEVGFGKPPKKNRFRKGVSGNPFGRPRGRRNLTTVLAETLYEKVVVVDDSGAQRTITRLEAAVRQLVNLAASGDLRALRHLTALVGAAEQESPAPANTGLTDRDWAIVRNVLQRAEECKKGPGGNNNENQ